MVAKGVAVKFKSFDVTVPAVLKLIKLDEELKKHDRIILKPSLKNTGISTDPAFVESVLKFCIANKRNDAEIMIAEGADGNDTLDLFEQLGYRSIAEKYSVGLLDLNTTEIEEIQDGEFLKFQNIMYPKILLNSFIISLPKLDIDAETEISGSLPNMLGAFPAEYYTGIFARSKNKIRKNPIKYAIHDILKCKMPQLAVVDASAKGTILAGQPLEIDKQSAKVLGTDWKNIQYLRLIDESFSVKEN